MATRPAALVLDSSAALQAVLPDSDAHRVRAEQLLSDILAGRTVAHVPVIFFNEVAAGLARAVRDSKKRLRKEDAEEFMLTLGLARLELSIEVVPAGVWFDRALAWGCQVADSAYLQLALSKSLPLATTDGGLITAATAQRVRVLATV